jgi:hypothetical protein
VEWPADAFRDSADTFYIAIIGKGATAEATERLLASKQVGYRAVVIKHAQWDESLVGMHAVFVTERDAKKLRRILDGAATLAVLTIGEGQEFAERGGMIGLLIENRKVRFDIDTGVAEAAGLRVSSKLLALTRVVHAPATALEARP